MVTRETLRATHVATSYPYGTNEGRPAWYAHRSPVDALTRARLLADPTYALSPLGPGVTSDAVRAHYARELAAPRGPRAGCRVP